MTDSTPPKGGEPTSFREKAKDWAEKHPRTIHLAKAAGAIAVMAVVVTMLKPGGTAEDEAKFTWYAEDTEDGTGSTTEDVEETESTTEDTDSPADSTEESKQRKQANEHNVVPHKRRLKDGREIDVSGYTRGGSSEDEDEGPDEAAA
ncbi:hypothetical protein [Streptomyces sp. NPDC045714]|uniref:hypothetical protein n=1 Tax=Streptomyces sp. NPDC045714 TaxID=3154913 RepID=UPI0033D300BA